MPLDLDGPYTFIVRTDADNDVTELAAESNNTKIDDASITVTQKQFPNLRIANVMVPPAGLAGKTVVVEWNEVNVSNAVSTGSDQWHNAVWLSSDDRLDSSDIRLATTPNAAALGPNESHRGHAEVTLQTKSRSLLCSG
ncbi:MAG: hypothetical protein R3C05_28230 [Pirellulaceae bacterium]